MAGRSLNKVQLIGNLGSDPESRYVQSGSAMTNFRIATSKTWTDQQSNQQRERTDWHSVVCWGRLAEIANQYLKKGSQVYIEGELQTRTFDRDGQTQYRTEVNCRELIMLGRTDQSAGPGNTSYDRPPPVGGGGRDYGNSPSSSRQPQRQPVDAPRQDFDDGDTELDDDLPF